jgi:hypothetical protein
MRTRIRPVSASSGLPGVAKLKANDQKLFDEQYKVKIKTNDNFQYYFVRTF